MRGVHDAVAGGEFGGGDDVSRAFVEHVPDGDVLGFGEDGVVGEGAG